MIAAVLIFLLSVFVSSVSQIILKMAADRPHKSFISEYLNVRVIIAYGLFFVSTILTMIALKTVPLSMSPIIEATGYIWIALMGHLFLKERFSRRKALGLALIIAGICIYSLHMF